MRYHRSIRQTGWEGGREVMVQPKITMVGRTYGRLTVLEQAEPLKKDRQAWYRCRCDCGGEITVRGTSLRNGSTASCGCLRREKTKKRNAEAAGKKFDLTGKRFAFLTAEKRLEERKKGSCLWLCRCDCGRYYKGKTHDLISGRVKSCGCIPSRVPEDLTGRRYGSLTVLELSGERKKNGAVVWKCRCDCGQETFVSSGNLKQGRTVSCGCVRRENLEGRRFGKLIVTGIGKQSGRGRGAFWNCLCDCGTYCEVHAYKLKSGHTRSCGCSHREAILDLTGQKFGKLTVLGDSGRRRDGSGGMIWKCLCSCGQEKEIRQDALVSGAAASCGCVKSRGNEKVARLLREAGLSYQPEYSPPDMKGKRRFDFAVWEAGKLSYLIEYDGVLHFGYSDSGWDTEARYQKMRVSDREKNAYCFQKGIPLIRVPYTRFSRLEAEDLHPGTTAYLVNGKSRRVVAKEKPKGEKEADEDSGEIFREDQIPGGSGDLTGSSGGLQKRKS